LDIVKFFNSLGVNIVQPLLYCLSCHDYNLKNGRKFIMRMRC
jgi:hypothetical protein